MNKLNYVLIGLLILAIGYGLLMYNRATWQRQSANKLLYYLNEANDEMGRLHESIEERDDAIEERDILIGVLLDSSDLLAEEAGITQEEIDESVAATLEELSEDEKDALKNLIDKVEEGR